MMSRHSMIWALLCGVLLSASSCHEKPTGVTPENGEAESSPKAGDTGKPAETGKPKEGGGEAARRGPPKGDPKLTPAQVAAKETHLKNIKQLTSGGENAEAYFSGDGKELIFQSKRGDLQCDQIFIMGIDGSNVRQVSTGKGRTTCSYFQPDGKRIVYASTHLGGENCPAPPPRTARGVYVWPVYEDYDIFSAEPDGSDMKRLTSTKGYDAEPTYSPDGTRIVFTSARDGDLEIYSMNADGSDQRRLTSQLGYDGGPFYSPDNKYICFRAARPKTDEAKEKYKALLADGLVQPSELEIYVMKADGSDIRQITSNGAANFCPFFHPNGKKIIYTSNHASPTKRGFDLFLVDIETKNEKQITFATEFDGFPMFSPDGSKIAWASNRNGKTRGETNVFIADWVE
ncbi:MAG: hypothetical protein AAF517_00115 [Planctomycetota bacterium]